MTIRNTGRYLQTSIIAPLATTFTGVGGLALHFGHGPEHLFCVALACAIAMGGCGWSFYNRMVRRAKFKSFTDI